MNIFDLQVTIKPAKIKRRKSAKFIFATFVAEETLYLAKVGEDA